jgi:hypothetical protein
VVEDVGFSNNLQDNSVDASLTGVYQVSVTLSFYAASASTPAPVVADVILPLKNPYGYQYGAHA